MPTVEVYNGDLEGALAVFKEKCKREGIDKSIRRGLSFTPAYEKRSHEAYKQGRRQRKEAGR